MKLFITGVSGLLGLNFALQTREHFEVSGSYHDHPISLDGVNGVALDVTQPAEMVPFLSDLKPDLIVHTAGLTDVEECEKNPGLAEQLNVTGARHIATIANDLGARLVHISTDHLFDGTKPWRKETETPAPLNNYAQTKWQAELAVLKACPKALVIRTNFFGWGSPLKMSFSDWILRALDQQQELNMFSDVFYTPILINRLIDLIIDMAGHDMAGVFNVAGSERISKHSFALQIADVFGYPKHLINATSVDGFPFGAQRPHDMSICSEKVENCLKVRVPPVAHGLEQLKSLQQKGWPKALEQAVLK